MTKLTPAETLVLRHLIGGYSNKEVARKLDLSVRTVETHRLNFRRKLGMRSKREMVTVARELGIQPV